MSTKNKIEEQVFFRGGTVINTLTTDYCGNIVYENGNLKFLLNEEGYTNISGGNRRFNYYHKDHLGNNRVVTAGSINETPDYALQIMNYYPFGMPYEFTSRLAPELQPYKFGGKELDEMHGLNWYDQGARPFDAIIPRTPTMDPLAEKYYSSSPYAMFGNNPVRYVDPDGMIWDEASLEEINKLKESLQSRIDELNTKKENYQSMINNGTLNDADVEIYTKEVSAFRDMASNLNQSTADINKLGGDPSHTYALSSNENIVAGYVSKGTNGKISIVGDGMALTVHEITHVRQSLDAEQLNFDTETNKLQYTGPGVEIKANAEVEAYQKQFSVKRTDLGTGLNLRGPNEITPQVIGNRRRANGALVYPDIYNRYVRNQR